jgi:Putative glycosyl/glycerophosphate transferases involved in teichoic acid biosynthesis TagF/TagB/EpsJ/RodC
MKKVRKIFIYIINSNPTLRILFQNAIAYLQKTKYKILYYNKNQIDDKIIIFEAYQGRQWSCSPKALYEAVINDTVYCEYTKVICFRKPEKYIELAENDKTILVKFRSKDYYRYYATAKYWISNSNLPMEIIKKIEQLYIQTWHGTPLKKIGCDLKINDRPDTSLVQIHKKYIFEGKKADIFLSPSPFYTEKIRSAFLIPNGKIGELGYPRNDSLYNINDENLNELKRKIGIKEDKKVILYAPTWRDNQFKLTLGSTYDIEMNFDLLADRLKDTHVILFRAHYLIANNFDFNKHKGFVIDVSNVDDINELYSISDTLITDYSSVFFDYANLKRPIIFYMYDYESYKNQIRDFYIDISELPGHIVYNMEELLEELLSVVQNNIDSFEMFNNKYNPYSKPCSKAIIDKYIGGNML